MKAFWREEELTENEAKLLQLCFEAHAKSALRQNISSVVLSETARGSGDYTKALMAALCTLGGVHAPLMDTWLVLSGRVPVNQILERGGKIPGWGSSFDDDSWAPVENHLREHFPQIWERIEKITGEIGKDLKPNPSCFTAATGIALKMPPQILPWLFINGRLNTWTCLFLQATMKAS